MPLDIAFIEPERELVNVAAKVFRTGVVIDADQPAFQDREHAFDAVGRHVVTDEFGSAVVDGFVIEEQTGEAAITGEFVGMQGLARLDVLMNDPVKGLLIGAFDRHRDCSAATLAHAEDGRLANRAATGFSFLCSFLLASIPPT